MCQINLFSRIIFSLICLFPISCNTFNEALHDQSQDENILTVNDAKKYFEDVYTNIDLKEQTGQSVNNIVPKDYILYWDQADIKSNSKITCVNVPILSSSGKLNAKTITAKDGKIYIYKTIVGQKLCVVKNKQTKYLSCFIVSIIPADKHSDKNKRFEDFPVWKTANESFTGTILCHTLVGNTILVDKIFAGNVIRHLYYKEILQKSVEQREELQKELLGNISFSYITSSTRGFFDEDYMEGDRCSVCGDVVCSCYSCPWCGEPNCSTDHLEGCPICGSTSCTGGCESVDTPYECDVCMGSCQCPYGKCHKSPCICNK